MFSGPNKYNGYSDDSDEEGSNLAKQNKLGTFDSKQGIHVNPKTIDLAPNVSEGKEEEREYMPADLARGHIKDMANRMKLMNSKHLKMLDEVSASYENIQKDKQRSYQETIEQLKLKAVERLQFQKKAMNNLEDELRNSHEMARKREQEWNKKFQQTQSKLEKLTLQRQTLLGKVSKVEEEKQRLINQSEHERAQAMFLTRYRADNDNRLRRLEEETNRMEDRMEEMMEELQDAKNSERLKKKDLKETKYQLQLRSKELADALAALNTEQGRTYNEVQEDRKVKHTYIHNPLNNPLNNP